VALSSTLQLLGSAVGPSWPATQALGLSRSVLLAFLPSLRKGSVSFTCSSRHVTSRVEQRHSGRLQQQTRSYNC
jgi:hypothetical protein